MTTLSICGSSELTWQAVLAYLSGKTLLSEGCSSDQEPVEASPGHDLQSLILASCPHVEFTLLEALPRYCPRLFNLSLKKLDKLFQGSAFPLLPKLASLALACDSVELPLDYFQAYRDHERLQHLSISSSKHIKSHHLSHFSSITKLVISGCPAISSSLPFHCLSKVREISYLGQGLDVASICNLWQSGLVRKVTLDSAQIPLRKPTQAAASRSSPTALPIVLRPFATSSLLAPTLPSWVVAYLISMAPRSLEAISILGTVEEASANPITRYSQSASCPYGWTTQDECHYTPWGLPHLSQRSSDPGFLQKLLSWLRWSNAGSQWQISDARLPILPLGNCSTRFAMPETMLAASGVRGGTETPKAAHGLSADARSVTSGPYASIAEAPVHDEGFLELLHLPLFMPGQCDGHCPSRSSRLTPEQMAWIHRMTGGRIVRLEV